MAKGRKPLNGVIAQNIFIHLDEQAQQRILALMARNVYPISASQVAKAAFAKGLELLEKDAGDAG